MLCSVRSGKHKRAVVAETEKEAAIKFTEEMQGSNIGSVIIVNENTFFATKDCVQEMDEAI